MSGKRVYLLIVASVATLFVLAACSEEVIPTQEPIEFSPTAASEVERPDSESNPASDELDGGVWSGSSRHTLPISLGPGGSLGGGP